MIRSRSGRITFQKPSSKHDPSLLGSGHPLGKAARLRSSFGSVVRLARAGFVLARAGVFSDVDPSILPPAARLPLALAKLIAAPGRNAGAKGKQTGERSRQSSRRDQQARAILRQARSVPRDTTRCRGHRGRGASRAFAGPDGAVSRAMSRSPPSRRRSAGSLDRIFDQLWRARRRRFDRPGPPRPGRRIAEGERDVAVKVLRPGVERLFRRDLGDMYFAARMAERWLERRPPPQSWSRSSIRSRAASRWKWISASKRRLHRNSPRTSPRTPDFRCRISIGTGPRKRC